MADRMRVTSFMGGTWWLQALDRISSPGSSDGYAITRLRAYPARAEESHFDVKDDGVSITAARRKVFISSTWLGKCVTGSNRGTRWPSFRDASVGIHPLGLLVLDIDGPLGEAKLRKLRERYPLPQTLKVISG